MRRNRKLTRRYSELTAHTAAVVVLIVTFVTAMLVYWFADSRCTQLAQDLGREERRFASLESERMRESARWDEMKTSEKLEAALLRHGLDMHYPRPEQVVRMSAQGKPLPGQIAVARAEARSGRAGRVAASFRGEFRR